MKRSVFKITDEEIDELDFYSEGMVEELLDGDEVTAAEAGFMRGYDED